MAKEQEQGDHEELQIITRFKEWLKNYRSLSG